MLRKLVGIIAETRGRGILRWVTNVDAMFIITNTGCFLGSVLFVFRLPCTACCVRLFCFLNVLGTWHASAFHGVIIYLTFWDWHRLTCPAHCSVNSLTHSSLCLSWMKHLCTNSFFSLFLCRFSHIYHFPYRASSPFCA